MVPVKPSPAMLRAMFPMTMPKEKRQAALTAIRIWDNTQAMVDAMFAPATFAKVYFESFARGYHDRLIGKDGVCNVGR